MAHTKSALKRVRQSKKRHLRNQSVKSQVRTTSRAFREALEQGAAEPAGNALRTAVRNLSRAASKGVIPKRTASRRISRLAKAAQKKLAAAG